MVVHEYICKTCKKTKEIDKPISEQYNPTCCGKEMARLWHCNILSGALNKANLPKQ